MARAVLMSLCRGSTMVLNRHARAFWIALALMHCAASGCNVVAVLRSICCGGITALKRHARPF